jgi:hypothetical protein
MKPTTVTTGSTANPCSRPALPDVERESPLVQHVEQGRQGDLRDVDAQVDVLRVPGAGPVARGQSADQCVGDTSGNAGPHVSAGAGGVGMR